MFEKEDVVVLSLEEKEKKSMGVIKKALKEEGKPAVIFTGGKDSIVLLHLIRATMDGKIMIPVIHIDTSVNFPETYEYINKMRKLWGFQLLSERNEEMINKIEIALDREKCCYELNTVALNNAIKKHGITHLFTQVRWDEQETRADEDYFSQRQDNVRVHAILHFTEQDIWDYIKKYNIPYCSLYDKGYRSIGCYSCTKPTSGGESDVERGDRSQDKKEIMERLRSLGYF